MLADTCLFWHKRGRLRHYGKATGQEIWQLAQEIQQSVLSKFGIQLVPEVNVV